MVHPALWLAVLLANPQRTRTKRAILGAEGTPMDQLREWRRQRLMTQAEVAKAVGVNVQSYSAWERGASTPRLAHLRALAKVLKVPPAALLAAFPDQGKAAAA